MNRKSGSGDFALMGCFVVLMYVFYAAFILTVAAGLFWLIRYFFL